MASKESTPTDVVSEKEIYTIGNRRFIVERIFCKETSETIGAILLKLLKSEIQAQ